MARSLSQALLTFLFWTTSKSFSSEIARQNNREKSDSYREDLGLQLDFLEFKLKETQLKVKSLACMIDGSLLPSAFCTTDRVVMKLMVKCLNYSYF